MDREPASTWLSNLKVCHTCKALPEYLYVDETGLLVLTERGVERVPVPEDA